MQAIISGYPRPDGRRGSGIMCSWFTCAECAHHVAVEIVAPFRERGAQVIGFSGCYPNAYSNNMLQRLCTHPNVGAALLISLGCEGFDRHTLRAAIEKEGRPVEAIGIQTTGGTRKAIAEGRAWLEKYYPDSKRRGASR